MIGGVLLLWGGAEWWSTNDLQRAQAKARAAGLAVTAEDLRDPPVAEGDNAAESYRFAAEIMKVMPADSWRTVNGFIPYSESSMLATFGTAAGPSPDRIAETHSQLKPVLRVIDRATSLSELNWDRDWNTGYRVLLPEYAALRRFARALLFDADMALRQRDSQRALRRFAQIRKIAHDSSREPTVIGLTMRLSIDRMSYALAGHFSRMNDSLFNAGIAKYLAKADPPDLRHALKGDAFLWTDLVPHFAIKAQTPGLESIKGSWQHKLMKSGFVQRGMQVRIFDHLREAVAALPNDPADFDGVLSATANLDKAFENDGSLVGKVTNAYMPARYAVAVRIVDTEAHRRMAQIQVALSTTYRGNWPQKLPPDLAQVQDPWSKKPFIYRRDGKNFLLYSVGSNLIDDGAGSGGQDVVSKP